MRIVAYICMDTIRVLPIQVGVSIIYDYIMILIRVCMSLAEHASESFKCSSYSSGAGIILFTQG